MLITVLQPQVEILTPLGPDVLKFLERAGRVCYKSEERITHGSAERFVKMIRDSNHESVLEHVVATVRVVGSRSMSHQLVRHRIAAYSQESQRYINYGKKGFQVICPPRIGLPNGPYHYDPNDPSIFYFDSNLSDPYPIQWFNDLSYMWLVGRAREYLEYQHYLAAKIPPEDARECLPNATKTEVVATYNLRTWRHVFEERALNSHAQWQIRGLMQDVLIEFGKALPAVFGDQLLRINAEQ
jgi:thymidylate synthase (FAD)